MSGDVPGGVRREFEEHAHYICELSRIDYRDRARKAADLTEQLVSYWRSFSDVLVTREAVPASLAQLGLPAEIARMHRNGLKGLWTRLLYYERYRIHRVLLLVVFCFLHHWIRLSSSAGFTVMSSSSLEYTFVFPNLNYYVALCLISTLALPHWLPAIFRLPRVLAQGVAAAVSAWFLVIVLWEWQASVLHMFARWTNGGWHRPGENVPVFLDLGVGVLWSALFLVELLGLCVSAPVFAAEIFDFPARRRIRREQRRFQGSTQHTAE